MERLCYVMRSIIKHMSDALVFLKGIILSLRRICMEQICSFLVILSGVEGSLCELSAESKDPYWAGDS